MNFLQTNTQIILEFLHIIRTGDVEITFVGWTLTGGGGDGVLTVVVMEEFSLGSEVVEIIS